MKLSAVLATLIVLLPGFAAGKPRCDIRKLAVEGIYPCGAKWWKYFDLGQSNNVTIKMSDLTKVVLNHFNPRLHAGINLELAEQLHIDSVDPMAKVLESTFTLFPSSVSFISEILDGLQTKPDMLMSFGIGPFSRSRTILQDFFIKDYFEASCSNFRQKGEIYSCFSEWVFSNCEIDRSVDFLWDLLDHFTTEYCNHDNTAKQSVLDIFNTNFGAVGAQLSKYKGTEIITEHINHFHSTGSIKFSFYPLLRHLAQLHGVEDNFYAIMHHSNSPEDVLFHIDQIVSPYLIPHCKQNLSSIIHTIQENFEENILKSSNIRVGSMKKVLEHYGICGLKAVGSLASELTTPSSLDKINLIVRRLGVINFKEKYNHFMP